MCMWLFIQFEYVYKVVYGLFIEYIYFTTFILICNGGQHTHFLSYHCILQRESQSDEQIRGHRKFRHKDHHLPSQGMHSNEKPLFHRKVSFQAITQTIYSFSCMPINSTNHLKISSKKILNVQHCIYYSTKTYTLGNSDKLASFPA